MISGALTLFSIAFSLVTSNPEIPSLTNNINVVTEVEQQILYEEADIEYLGKCIEAEAQNQGYMGKVYVMDCILNLMDYLEYDNFSDCINRKNMFECVSNGMINKMTVTEETYAVIYSELQNRTDYDIMFFRTNYYHSFGTPKFQYGDHYFSTR